MPSIQYKLIETMFGALGVNKMLDKQGADFEKLLKKYSEKQKKPLKIPYKKLEKQFDVPLTVHIGEGMMHCWGAMDFVPEARAVRREYFAALQ